MKFDKNSRIDPQKKPRRDKYLHLCQEVQRTRKSIVEVNTKDITDAVNKLEGKATPQTTILSRVKKLEKDGFIKGWRAILDPNKFAIGETYVIQVQFTYSDLRAPRKILDQRVVAKTIAKRIPQAYGVFITSGESDIMLLVRVKNQKELAKVVLDNLRKIPGVARSNSVSVMEVVEDPIDHTQLEI